MWNAIKSAMLLLSFSTFLFTTAHKETNNCSPINHMNTTKCKQLITLGAEFGWNINNETHIDIVFSIPTADDAPKWVAWGVNPGRPQMIGTRAIIGISQPNGTLKVSRYNITSDTKLGCRLKPLQDSENFEDVVVQNMRGDVNATSGYMSISATLIWRPDSAAYHVEKLNHVWQVGYELADDVPLGPLKHRMALQNVDSTETINLNNGKGITIGHRRHHIRTVHGILNIVGWGTLLPFGIVGYLLGTAGWAIGIWLGHASKDYHFHTHNMLAMFIFAFTTLQMIALRLRPTPTDDYRKYWDMYHHFLGYALLAVIIVNIFHGIAILKPNKTWLWAYIGILAAFASIALGLEIYTWFKFIFKTRERKKEALQLASTPS
ncbi:hypothetical protein M0R45_015315 [Rubus argutus]|uniref:DOMON domain-containing protein n=1 Tax=Rubus argutus TaxID=59490 RepID=A0AAW1XQ95_RUBAR